MITVKDVVVYAYDGLAKKYSAEQLDEVLLPANGVTVLSCDEQGLAFLCEGEDPQFVFSPEAMNDIQKSFSKNNTIALFVLYLFLAGLAVVAFRERIKTICFGDKKKTAVTAGQIAYFTVLCLLEQNAYAGHLGFRMQTALLLGILLLSVIARLVFCASEKRKPVATCVAVTVFAETVYGSSFGGKVFATFAPDAILYLVAVVCAVLFLCYCLWNGKDASAFLWVFGTVSVFQFSACIFSYEYTFSEAFEKTFHYWSQHQCMITTLALTGFFMLLRGVLGKGIALVMYTIVYLVFQVGNLIEMIYHQSVFKPLDFLAFTEAVDVAKNYLNPVTVTVMAVCFLVCVFCLWKFRRQILEFLRPATNGASFVFGAMLLLWVFSSLYHNVYSEWWIYSHYTWGSESARLKKQGYVPYFYYYSMRTKDVFPEEPENYSEETIQTILSSVESDSAEKELTNYIQSVKRTDEFFAELIAYVEQRERPTVIVMFGDHRPPLEALDVIGANADYAEKYATACYAYSNFGEIKPPAERISINYIPALVVEYAGIEKSGFYNYLYDLQKRHPVVSYIFPDETFTAEQDNYKLLQYDIMFGEGYCGK